jgi:predicted DNA-binding transcriptional regulator YafY
VADERWLVRQVLEYGGEAEVVSPPNLRLRVRNAARRVADRHA